VLSCEGLEPSTGEISTIGLDIAKSVFPGACCGRGCDPQIVSRPKVLEHFGELPPCLIGSMRVRQSTTAARGVSGPAESDSIGGCPYPITV